MTNPAPVSRFMLAKRAFPFQAVFKRFKKLRKEGKAPSVATEVDRLTWGWGDTWISYRNVDRDYTIVIAFANEADRNKFLETWPAGIAKDPK